MTEIYIPVKTVSEANSREHWRVKTNRKRAQQREVSVEWRRAFGQRPIPLPCVVTLTRIAPKALDDDNLRSAFKGIRDCIARQIGVDDGSELIRFEYKQIPIRSRKYAISVQVETVEEALKLIGR